MQIGWNRAFTTLYELLTHIQQLPSVSSSIFNEMRRKRNEIREELAGVMVEMKTMDDTRAVLEAEQARRHSATLSVQQFSDFKQQKSIETTELMNSDHYNTVCASLQC